MTSRLAGVLVVLLSIIVLITPIGFVFAGERPNTTKAIEDTYMAVFDEWNAGMSPELFQRINAEAVAASLDGKWRWGCLCAVYLMNCYDDLAKIATTQKEKNYYLQKENDLYKMFMLYTSYIKDVSDFKRVIGAVQKHYEASKTRDATVKKIRTFILLTK